MVAKVPRSFPLRRKRPGKKSMYPWDRWFREAEGKWLTLTEGKDFNCTAAGFAQQIRSRALERGIRVSVSFASDDKPCPTCGRREVTLKLRVGTL